MTDDMAPENTKSAQQQAIEWHVLLSSGDAADADWQAFAEWLVASADHQEAYDKVERLSLDLEHVSQDVIAQLDNPPIQVKVDDSAIVVLPVWRQLSVQITAAAAVFVLGIALVIRTFVIETDLLIETSAGDIRRITLEDGSKVSVDANSALEIAFNADERKMTLRRGAAVFTVLKDKVRPFIVMSGDRTIRVTGTVLEVENRANRFRVAVAEGRVEFRNVSENGPALEIFVLRQGQQIEMENNAPPVIETVSIDDIGAWRDGRLVFDEVSMDHLVSRLNDYFEGDQFSLQGSELVNLRFTGALKISDAQSMASRLEGLLPVQTSREGDRILIRGLNRTPADK